MVTNVDAKFGILLAIILLTTIASPANASVVASIDRGSVELNESFTLKVTVDTAINTEPDVTSLNNDFDIGTVSQLSNTTIVNGQISRSRTWTYVLMARRAGELTIPPVIVGSEKSNPLMITISEPSAAVPGEADIFVSTEVDLTESYVQAQVLYTVKVYRSVATRQPRLSEPVFSGVDVLVEIAGEQRSYESMLNGKSYNVVESVYALFPQESGELSIAPARFEARVLREGRITGRKVFESESVRVNVKPIPPPPADFPDAAWFPARSVELRESWSREPGGLPTGEPITRHITVSALGQLATQIPVIEPATADSIKIYPDKPELSNDYDAEGVRAIRRDQYAMIGVDAGEVVMPAVELPWWSIDEGKWRVATLPASSITILPSADAPVVAEEPAVEAAPDTDESTQVSVEDDPFWRLVSEGLAVAWVLTLFAWWWSRRPRREVKEPPPPPIHKQQARELKAARRAALEGDAHGVRASLLQWGRLEWPTSPPRSVGELATRVSAPLAMQLEKLCRSSYGPDGQEWNKEELARSLRSFSVLSPEDDVGESNGLPPLMPERAA